MLMGFSILARGVDADNASSISVNSRDRVLAWLVEPRATIRLAGGGPALIARIAPRWIQCVIRERDGLAGDITEPGSPSRRSGAAVPGVRRYGAGRAGGVAQAAKPGRRSRSRDREERSYRPLACRARQRFPGRQEPGARLRRRVRPGPLRAARA